MTPKTVWFNQHFSNTWHTLQILQQSKSPGEFRILCSHTRGNYPGKRLSDIFVPEPAGISDEEYVDFCLHMIKTHAVDIFWPWRRLHAILQERERFTSAGVHLIIVAERSHFDLLQNKGKQYAALQGSEVIVPDFAVVNTFQDFDEAYQRLRPRHEILCCKPAVSMFGWGFRVIIDNGVPESEAAFAVTLNQMREKLKAKDRFSDLLLMPYLPGPERSVDCLAHNGKLLRCIVRKKDMVNGYRQIIEHHEQIERMVDTIAVTFQLNGVFNAQFRDRDGVPHLLEINPRMSGGSPFASASGLVLPYWAIRLALGTTSEEDIPYPTTGIEINTARYPGSL